MSKRELSRGEILAEVKAGKMRLNKAAEKMRVGYR